MSIHNQFEDRFDRYVRQPNHVVKIDNIYNIKLSKQKFESLNQESTKCSEDQLYGPLRNKSFEVGLKFIEKYNCTLPWMSLDDYPGIPTCEVSIVPNTDNDSEYEFVPISTMIYDWNSLNQDVPDYEDLLPCNRTIYEDLIEEKSNSQADYEEATGINGSKVIIQYSNPYIQVIKDSRSYDMQSLIGEVGGTLGLLLGFSFVSIFDLLEQIIEGFFS